MENLSGNIEINTILTLSENKAVCNLFTIQGIKILFDCGWDDNFSDEIANIYREKITFDIDHIFISNNSVKNLGALPLLNNIGKLKNCTIHCTTPVAKLGFYVLLDAIIAKIEMNENFNILSEKDMREPFMNISEVKYKENIEIKSNDLDILIYPVPCGASLGGCSWKIIYKLQSIIYAPQFNLENKYICDPFPYEDLKNPNYFITDSKYSKELSFKKIVVENKFKKNLISLIEKNKHVFIPCDVANINLEVIILIEKILDEYNSSKNKDDSNKSDLNYKVVLCGYSANEIIESVKSLIEFMGSSISRQFYSYNENPFNLRYVHCVKDEKEFLELRKTATFKFIVLSAMDTLDSGISYKIFPKILEDPDFYIFILMKIQKNSILKEIIRRYQSGEKDFEYIDIKRIPISTDKMNENEDNLTTENIDENTSKIEEVKPSDQNGDGLYKNNNFINCYRLFFGDFLFKKKLFAKKKYPMFNYDIKKKITDYGLEISEKDLKIIKSKLDENNNNFETSFKNFLTGETADSNSNFELKIKIRRLDIFSKAKYEYTKKKIFIRCEGVENIEKFTYYPLFTTIDFITKQTIIDEVNPKKSIIFLGTIKKKFTNTEMFKNKQKKNFEIIYLNNIKDLNENINNTYNLKFDVKIYNVKYDSKILQKLNYSVVKDFGPIYDLKNSFLRIKTKRNNFEPIEINLVPQEEVKFFDENHQLKNNICLDSSSDSEKDEVDNIYNKNNIKLFDIKKDISKLFNEEIIIFGDYISNKNQEFKLFIRNGDIVLEGGLNNSYMKVRKFIQDYISCSNFSNEM